MPKPLVADELWAIVEPLLPKEPPRLKAADHALTSELHTEDYYDELENPL